MKGKDLWVSWFITRPTIGFMADISRIFWSWMRFSHPTTIAGGPLVA